MCCPVWHCAGDWVLIKTSEQSGQADGLLGIADWEAAANRATCAPASDVCPLGGTKTHFNRDNCSKLSRWIKTGVSSSNRLLLYLKSFWKSITLVQFLKKKQKQIQHRLHIGLPLARLVCMLLQFLQFSVLPETCLPTQQSYYAHFCVKK